MGKDTKIQWTDHTFNPWYGCAKVSPGCKHCYAEHDTPARVSRAAGLEVWGPHAARKLRADAGWDEPRRWNRSAFTAGVRRKVFCLSQGDWLEDRDDLDEPLARLLGTVRWTPHLDWQLLTKRPENWRKRLEAATAYLESAAGSSGPEPAACGVRALEFVRGWLAGRTPVNVWFGVSVESQDYAGRLDEAFRVPARVHFVSAEPLLGPLDLRRWLARKAVPKHREHWPVERCDSFWVIAGGESGSDARPCDIAWFRDLRDQCVEYGVPYYLKQLGYRCYTRDPGRDSRLGVHAPGWKGARDTSGMYGLCLHNAKGGDWDEWPAEDLRVREFPEPRFVPMFDPFMPPL